MSEFDPRGGGVIIFQIILKLENFWIIQVGEGAGLIKLGIRGMQDTKQFAFS